MTQIPLTGSITAQVLKHAPKGQVRAARFLSFQEGQGGGTMMKWIQHVGTACLPKVLASRTGIEGAEIGELELGESVMTYALPMALGPALVGLFARVAGKTGRVAPESMTQSLSELEQKAGQKAEMVGKVLPKKAAVILSTIGAIGVFGESLVNYGKNIITVKVFKKDKFSDVVNLSATQSTQPVNDSSPQVKKAKRRILQSAGIFGGILAGSGLLAAFGHRVDALKGASRWIVKHLDFDFSKTASGKVRYGLGNRKGLLGAMMLACSVPYIDSARDRYERLETLLRLPVVFGYILYGQDLMQKALVGFFPNLFKGALNPADQRLKSMEQIAEDALSQAVKKAGGTLEHPSEEALRLAATSMQAPMKAKALSVGIPLAVGIFGTGLGLSLLNRALTAYRFKKGTVQRRSVLPVAPQPAGNPFPSTVPPQILRGTQAPYGLNRAAFQDGLTLSG